MYSCENAIATARIQIIMLSHIKSLIIRI
jgi:hypothetical protein